MRLLVAKWRLAFEVRRTVHLLGNQAILVSLLPLTLKAAGPFQGRIRILRLPNKMALRISAVPLANLAGSIPEVSVPHDVDHTEVASTCVQYLNSLKPQFLVADALWRDLLALTGT